MRRLGPQEVDRPFVLDRSDRGPEQAIEVAWLGELTLRAAVRAGDLGQPLRRPTLALLERLDELVGAETFVTGAALRQRIDERVDMARRHPHLGRQDHRRVQPDDIIAAPHDGLPPLAPDVLLELHAERSVVPRRPGTP